MNEALRQAMAEIAGFLAARPAVGNWYTAIARFIFPVLAVLILLRAVRSLLRLPTTPETWAQLSLPNGAPIPLTHWENILGRGGSADVRLNFPSVSRQHAAICRDSEGNWTVYDLGSKGGTAVNGEAVTASAPLKLGDTVTLGGVPLLFLPQTVGEQEELDRRRRAEQPAALWPSFLWLTLFQVLTCLQLMVAAGAIGLLGITLVLGQRKYGATNWISLGGMSFQPSEIAKICYIYAGSATLERLFHRRNLTLFMVLTGGCIGLLALMSDFGTAAIFFVTFLVIAYLRSGDFATLGLICGAAAFGAGIVLKFKPYILSRFASWGHAWQNTTSGAGYQQSRTMSAAASGGLVGVGAGNGWLHNVGAGDTDLVFGMLCEEWGLLIAILAVLSIVTLAVFAARSCRSGRSSYYTIAGCAAASLMVFQTCLNVFGATDLLPLTGVTFPFVSNGGSAMMGAWGLLAFLKATDTRENASFATSMHQRRTLRTEAQRRAEPVGDPFAQDAPGEEDAHEED